MQIRLRRNLKCQIASLCYVEKDIFKWIKVTYIVLNWHPKTVKILRSILLVFLIQLMWYITYLKIHKILRYVRYNFINYNTYLKKFIKFISSYELYKVTFKRYWRVGVRVEDVKPTGVFCKMKIFKSYCFVQFESWWKYTH